MPVLIANYQPFEFTAPKGAPVLPRLAKLNDPSPQIGPVACAASTIDRDGFSIYDHMSNLIVDPGKRGIAAWKRALISLFPIAPMFAIGGGLLFAALADAAGVSSAALTIVAQIGALAFSGLGFAFGMWWLKKLGLPFRIGENVFVGSEGIDVIRAEKEQLNRFTVRFDGPEYWFQNHESVRINGNYAYDLESLAFFDAKLSHFGTVAATYHAAAGPNDETLIQRVAKSRCLAARLPLARQSLSAGAQLQFPITHDVRRDRRFSGEQVVLKNGNFFHEKAGGQTRVAVSDLAVRAHEGTIVISSNNSATPLSLELKICDVGNAGLFLGLFNA